MDQTIDDSRRKWVLRVNGGGIREDYDLRTGMKPATVYWVATDEMFNAQLAFLYRLDSKGTPQKVCPQPVSFDWMNN